MKLWGGATRIQGLKRFSVISRVLIKHGLGDVVDHVFKRHSSRSPVDDVKMPPVRVGYPSPHRLRKVLEELGPSFIKLGQLMSTRSDVFPQEYIVELAKLQDRVPPVAFDAVRQVIESELQKPIEDIFRTFAQDSMAAASVAQVHIAELTSGEKVAVKVVRPGIDKKIRQDIQLMYYFAEKIEKSAEIGRVIGLVNLVKEFERTVFRELDMFIEAGSMERFAKNFRDVEELYIPKVHWEHISKSVLVMEKIDGIKMDDVPALIEHGIDPQEVAMIGLRSFSRQLMDFGFFHADPHPGNTIVMYDGRVSLVDFGIIGYLDEETMMQIAFVFLGYAERDYDMVMDALKNAGLLSDESIDLVALRIDLKDISEPFYGRSLKTIAVRDVYEQVMQLVYKYQIRLPRNLLLLLKTFVQTEALGKILGSEASLLEVTRPYAKALLNRAYDAEKIMRNLGKEGRRAGMHLKLVPKYLNDILKQTASGKQGFKLRHSGFEEIDRKIEKGVNRITVGLVISASLVAAAMILNSTQPGLEIAVNFLGQKTVSLTTILGLTGYSLATVLGLWLIISILRSGRL